MPMTHNFNFGLAVCVWSMMNLAAEFVHKVWSGLCFFVFIWL